MSAPAVAIDCGPSIAALAKRMGVPRPTLFYQLMALHAADRLRAERRGEAMVTWLYRWGGQGRTTPWRVNLSRLLQMHPEFAKVAPPDELEERVAALEERMHLSEMGTRSLRARVRRLESAAERGPRAGA